MFCFFPLEANNARLADVPELTVDARSFAPAAMHAAHLLYYQSMLLECNAAKKMILSVVVSRVLLNFHV